MTIYNSFRIGADAVMQEKTPVNKQMYFLSKTIKFANVSMDAGLADVQTIIDIPASTLVVGSWVRVLTACTANATIDLGYGSDVNYWGNGLPLDATGIVPTQLTGTVTWDAAAIADGDEEAKDITVDGASFGDSVFVDFGAIDVADLALVAQVTAANTVTAQLLNNTGGAPNLASTTTTVYVNKAPRATAPLLFTSADTIDIIATTDTEDINLTSGVIKVVALCIDARYAF